MPLPAMLLHGLRAARGLKTAQAGPPAPWTAVAGARGRQGLNAVQNSGPGQAVAGRMSAAQGMPPAPLGTLAGVRAKQGAGYVKDKAGEAATAVGGAVSAAQGMPPAPLSALVAARAKQGVSYSRTKLADMAKAAEPHAKKAQGYAGAGLNTAKEAAGNTATKYGGKAKTAAKYAAGAGGVATVGIGIAENGDFYSAQTIVADTAKAIAAISPNSPFSDPAVTAQFMRALYDMPEIKRQLDDSKNFDDDWDLTDYNDFMETAAQLGAQIPDPNHPIKQFADSIRDILGD